jgi:hypothetical protein
MRTILLFSLVLLSVGCQQETPNAPAPRGDILFGPSMQAGTVDEDAAFTIARRAVATNDYKWSRVVLRFVPEQKGSNWVVTATQTDASGRPLDGPDRNRQIHINERGAVTAYIRAQ